MPKPMDWMFYTWNLYKMVLPHVRDLFENAKPMKEKIKIMDFEIMILKIFLFYKLT